MTHSISSAAFASATLLALSGIGLSGHLQQSERLAFGDLLNGTAQTAYEAGFDGANAASAFAVDAVGALKLALFGQSSDGAVLGKDGWIFTSEEFESAETFDANIIASAERVARAVSALRRKGITVLPVVIPDKSDVYVDELEFVRPSAVERRLDQFRMALSVRDVAFLDARPTLKQAAQIGDVFVKDDTHWSPPGSRKVAEAIASNLAHLDYSRVAVNTTQGPSVAYDGDLLSFVPTGRWRSLIGPEQFAIETFKTEVDTQGDLFDAPGVEIALVGTSFSARAAFHFEGFLKQALQADILNFAQEGQGPFAPMDAFLASEFLKSTPPKVVIWEIPVRYVSKDL
ncbi:alginate O-acetyltransferase AlgX-related protein [Sulfitobacter mediterraneus]|jgi:alginate O-acetyltransferase complex protein AlgJ|uniref:Alginate O-acetyltransferase complex protein AlgJ n=1 Tax=Sulfitobacter mediterraneus TaxID=83219 RepID=A0A2T6CGA8_9RHOB|nr:hypothetical protein [Sulfitobacter mediterraneus]KIN77587.1 putative alginate biosynthesis protein algJ [Sulfitobacter mediterraneus KCTC 32188]PTX74543.1 alginate O-acetyltransferase complex protein AlgJ [Sulfitobacter mediterraneus]